MVLSRFWVVILCLLVGVASLAAYITHAVVAGDQKGVELERLSRDRVLIEALLKQTARSRIDSLAPFAADRDVREALRAASQLEADKPDTATVRAQLNTKLKAQLQALDTKRRGGTTPVGTSDMLIAVDDSGTIVAQLGPSEQRYGGGLGTFPLVDRALRGYLRDDVWLHDRKVYGMAAVPVVDNGIYVGAIVFGEPFDAKLCDALAERVAGEPGSVTVAFFLRDAVVAASQSASAPGQAEIGAALGTVLGDDQLKRGDATAPYRVGTKGSAIFSLVTGAAAKSQVGYAVARTQTELLAPLDMVLNAGRNELSRVPVGVIGGVIGALILLSMLLFFIERDRPQKKLEAALRTMGNSASDRLTVTEFGGATRRVAVMLNEAMDKVVAQASAMAPKKKADIDDILGQAPAAAPPGFFSFASPTDAVSGRTGPDEEMRTTDMFPDIGGASKPAPIAAPSPPPPAPLSPPPAPPGPSALFDPPAAKAPIMDMEPPTPAFQQSIDSIGSIASLMQQPQQSSPPTVAFAAPAPDAAAASTPGPKPHTFAKAAAAPAPPPKIPAPPGRPVPAPPKAVIPRVGSATMLGIGDAVPTPAIGSAMVSSNDEEGATMAVAVPNSLIKKASVEAETGESTRVGELSADMTAVVSAADEEERHFRETYDQFIALKKQCGEQTAGVTYEKFQMTLRRNRDQLMSQKGVQGVRFTVYAKDGKAALKASPVR